VGKSLEFQEFLATALKKQKNCAKAGSGFRVSSLEIYFHVGVSKNRDTPKRMVYNGNPYIEMDDLGVPLFLETPMSSSLGKGYGHVFV